MHGLIHDLTLVDARVLEEAGGVLWRNVFAADAEHMRSTAGTQEATQW
jgi:hypothetical protein